MILRIDGSILEVIAIANLYRCVGCLLYRGSRGLIKFHIIDLALLVLMLTSYFMKGFLSRFMQILVTFIMIDSQILCQITFC